MNNQLKKIILTFCSCLIGTALFAQQQKAIDPTQIRQKASQKTMLLKQQLNLSAEQEKTVAELTQTVAFKSAEGQQNQAELDEYFNSNMITILNAKQLEKFNNLNNSSAKEGSLMEKKDMNEVQSQKNEKATTTPAPKKKSKK